VASAARFFMPFQQRGIIRAEEVDRWRLEVLDAHNLLEEIENGY